MGWIKTKNHLTLLSLYFLSLSKLYVFNLPCATNFCVKPMYFLPSLTPPPPPTPHRAEKESSYCHHAWDLTYGTPRLNMAFCNIRQSFLLVLPYAQAHDTYTRAQDHCLVIKHLGMSSIHKCYMICRWRINKDLLLLLFISE